MVFFSLLIAVSVCTMSTAIVSIIGFFFPQIYGQFTELMNETFRHPLTIVTAVILAPIGEEVLCRGIILHYAMKVSRRFWVANIIQAVMFTIIHMNLVQSSYVFLLGLVLGWLRYRYKSLAAPIITHFFNNFSTMSWLAWLLSFVPGTLANYFIVLSLAVSATAGLLLLIGKRKEEVH
jgi:membrane protease YdiL (CAAX protease family)